MGTLRTMCCALALCLAPPAGAETGDSWRAFVAEAAQRFGIPAGWIWRVMAIESRGRTMLGGRPIRSPKGAMGLMQLMPATWAQMRAAHGLGPDPDDPHDNILAGAAYLREMYDRFGYPGLFAAYNAGPARYEAALAGTASLPGETRNYLAMATGSPALAPAPARPPAAPASLFAVDRRSPEVSPEAAGENLPSDNPLIVIRRK